MKSNRPTDPRKVLTKSQHEREWYNVILSNSSVWYDLKLLLLLVNVASSTIHRSARTRNAISSENKNPPFAIEQTPHNDDSIKTKKCSVINLNDLSQPMLVLPVPIMWNLSYYTMSTICFILIVWKKDKAPNLNMYAWRRHSAEMEENEAKSCAQPVWFIPKCYKLSILCKNGGDIPQKWKLIGLCEW